MAVCLLLTCKVNSSSIELLQQRRRTAMSSLDQIVEIFEEQDTRIKELETTVAEVENKLKKALDRLELLEQNVAYIERDVDRVYPLEEK